MINIGDIVARKSYNKDINFRVVKMDEDNVILEGTFYRLVSDAPIDDLELSSENSIEIDDKKNTIYREKVTKTITSNRKYLSGRILHIDGDKKYLNQCLELYKAVKVYAIGVHIPEYLMKDSVLELIEIYKPEIVVITGHDSYNKKGIKDITNYKNSRNFINSVTTIRSKYTKNDILIVAGACQSHFEALIASGCNFASSPKRVNIHAYDPAIIAIKASVTPFNKIIDIRQILKHSYIKREGIGGVETLGKMRLII